MLQHTPSPKKWPKFPPDLEIVEGDIWNFHEIGVPICIPTNGIVHVDNHRAIMGAGLALQAQKRYRDLPRALGEKLGLKGNHTFVWNDYGGLITFPTKRHYREDSSLDLIRRSAKELRNIRGYLRKDTVVVLPMVGTGYGHLKWDDVYEVLCEELTSLGSWEPFIICKKLTPRKL